MSVVQWRNARSWRDPFPDRADEGCVPLIEASEAYPRLEGAILAAEREVLLGFRIIDPTTGLKGDAARQAGLTSWGDLLADAVRRGVTVRLLMTDFDPVAANALHRGTWASLNGFREAASSYAGTGNLQAIAALHEGEFGPWLRRLLWPVVRWQLAKLQQAHEQSGDGEMALRDSSPGLWRMLRTRGKRLRVVTWPPPRMWPATYHQKLAVVDGETVIIGGLDVDERRYDDPDHQRPSDQTWHDVSLLSQGIIAADARHHFVTCWNQEVPRFNARLTALGAPRDDLPAPVSQLSRDRNGTAPGNRDGSTVRLIRTLSRRSRSAFAIGPRAAVLEIEQAHIALIRTCNQLLYIETQFFRSARIAQAIADAAERNPDLRVILVLPAAPEDVVFDGNGGPDAQHGEWLQVCAIERVMEAFGDRAAFFSLVRSAMGHGNGERDTIDGREIAYLHSKVMIADATSAIVSSANLNGRSLRWDTEAGLLWRNPQEVRSFQRKLWSVHLRDGLDEAIDINTPESLAMWRRAAEPDAWSNAEAPPQIARYPFEAAKDFARSYWFVPHDLV